MIIEDRAYGKQEVTEAVLIDLINSKPLTRLKKISQHGASSYVFDWADITRFEHCVGAMLLIRMYGGELEEQIAGLLHDVPHTAFSHVVDYIFESEEHNYHERFFRKIIFGSEIPQILKKHGINTEKVVDPEKFGLLERPIPNLCADRIDYFLRHLIVDPRFEVNYKKYLQHLIVYRHEFVFDDPKVAYEYSLNYLRANELSWASPFEIGLFVILA